MQRQIEVCSLEWEVVHFPNLADVYELRSSAYHKWQLHLIWQVVSDLAKKAEVVESEDEESSDSDEEGEKEKKAKEDRERKAEADAQRRKEVEEREEEEPLPGGEGCKRRVENARWLRKVCLHPTRKPGVCRGRVCEECVCACGSVLCLRSLVPVRVRVHARACVYTLR